MKKYATLFMLSLAFSTISFSQNAGIGTTEPQNKLQVMGNLLVNEPTTLPVTAPTGLQTKTMINASLISFFSSDSTGRLYDPGGPAGNYLPNLTANAEWQYLFGNCIGIELTVETMQLGTGDSLIIKENAAATDRLLAVGNGYTTTGKWLFNTPTLFITFKSNGDANVGSGFSLLFKRLYPIASTGVSGAAGKALFFDAANSIFRAGYISVGSRGNYSTAIGLRTTASGLASVALGQYTTASGLVSFATGSSSIASGEYSTAMGVSTEARGAYSTAIGYNTIASGITSFATGFSTTASSVQSTAMGSSTIASGFVSTAMGSNTTASGNQSTAMGASTTASGLSATAMGINTTASGDYSTAMGSSTIASGAVSTALGRNTTASGEYSTAMGNYVSTNNFDGSLIIGDNSTTTVLNIATSNSFRARFDGGYRFFTSAAAINAESCQLPAGGNAWVTASDYRLKEKFQLSDGENFLQKIAAMKLGSWNYISQNPNSQRHYGPMAQDFYKAFGKDNHGTIGNDTTINSADFAGVNLIAIQALEKRTQKIEQLEKENEALRNENAAWRKRIENLEAILLPKQ